eukprot:1318152-Amorphochlora_amoeboformis.AAC.1
MIKSTHNSRRLGKAKNISGPLFRSFSLLGQKKEIHHCLSHPSESSYRLLRCPGPLRRPYSGEHEAGAFWPKAAL